ncbi:multimeric flavodoxin WrbA [Desulfosporosinus orientis DSM 765]|uniref:Multimeric flavodoxin WrbA n=1 Tax=Desulfosporosinus orientis (strain ATCC 19365 / DSM 765 / NCIMB 8382 / VKM B-1628 / Singapore I) TaxID=768706 RepID=G7WH51_DESOD|nr:flavodoxin family protein [Desulfosporosinus orientis]AET69559.1 multimeric flavodoxin WrbA [Desulfosporosinus orientis DSM 765]
MKVISINGSPRKNWNTDILLQKALNGAKSVGAQTEAIHLYDLNFKGCISCFACKKKNSKYIGHCAMKDDLTNVLEKILVSDVLLLGSPIYFGNVTGLMRSFLERLLFSNLSYNEGHRSVFPGKVSSGFIYTMNVPKEFINQVNYEALFQQNKTLLEILNGTSEFIISADTYQFDNYSKYEASRFNENHKAKVKAEQFPLDCQKAFDLGVKLASN